MASRGSFSPDVLEIQAVVQTRHDTAASLRFYYTEPGIERRDAKFVGYALEDVRHELSERLEELDRSAAFGLLAALEATFRLDYLRRCDGRWKDPLSRWLRNLYKKKGHRAGLDEEILEGWRENVPMAKALISELRGAFRYRHWLAHGRYWVPKLGRRYDFTSIYLLAQEMEAVFQEQEN